MDKKAKHHRDKKISEDDLADTTPRGARFDTEEGRAAQGMRRDIGSAPAGEDDAAPPGEGDASPADDDDDAPTDRVEKGSNPG